MPHSFDDLKIDDVLRFRDFEGTVVRRTDDAVAVVDADGVETVLTLAELDRIKDETVVSYERRFKKTEQDIEVERIVAKALCEAFLELEKQGRTTRWFDDFVWPFVPNLTDVMLTEVRRLRTEYGEGVRAPFIVSPRIMRQLLTAHEYRPRLFAIPGGKAADD